MKKIALLLLVVAMVFSMAACKTRDVVICKVGDTEILRSEYEGIFNAYYQSAIYQFDMTNAANLKMLQDMVFDALVRAEVIYQQAVAQGFTLTAEEEQQLEQDAQAQYDAAYASYRSQATTEGAADVEARAQQLFSDALKQNGFTESSLREKIAEDLRKSAMARKLEQAVRAEITFTEQDAQARFSQDVEADRATYTQSPAAFADAQGAYEASGAMPPLYIPEGYARVKHILVEKEEDAAMLMGRIAAGEDFDALMDEFGTDPGMKAEPNKSLGYLMNKDTNFVPEFKEAALALKAVGDVTQPVKTDFGYHIIKLVEQLKSGERSFADVKDAYMSGKLSSLQSQHFNDKIAEWTEAAAIKRYDDRIRDLGRAQ